MVCIYSPVKKHTTPNRTPDSTSLGTNITHFEKQFEHCDDLIFRRITINETQACFIYLTELVNDQFLKGLSENINATFHQMVADVEEAIYRSFPITKISKCEEIELLFHRVLSGNVALLIEGFQKAIVINAAKYKTREIEESPNEQVVRGPREGFIEDIQTNLSLIRRKLKSSNLKVESLILGTETIRHIKMGGWPQSSEQF